MPRIDAPTVAEHHAHVESRLLDAAERLLKAGEPLTAGAVSKAAGIARNSIYRYVESVDELRRLVVARHLPSWLEGVERAMNEAPTASDKVVAWVDANLDLAAQGGHSWLRDTSGSERSDHSDDTANRAHSQVREPLVAAWRDAAPSADAELAASLTFGLLDAGFALLETGHPEGEVRRISRIAAAGMAAALGAEQAPTQTLEAQGKQPRN